VRRIADAAIGDFAIPGPAARFSRWGGGATLSAVALGVHNEEILREVLGLTENEIERLYQDKTIVRDPLLDGGRRKRGDAAG